MQRSPGTRRELEPGTGPRTSTATREPAETRLQTAERVSGRGVPVWPINECALQKARPLPLNDSVWAPTGPIRGARARRPRRSARVLRPEPRMLSTRGQPWDLRARSIWDSAAARLSIPRHHDGSFLCPPGHHLHHVLGHYRHRRALVRAEGPQPRGDHHHAGHHCRVLLPLLAHRHPGPAEPPVRAPAEERDHLVRALPVGVSGARLRPQEPGSL